jgi:hypothetical protein
MYRKQERIGGEASQRARRDTGAIVAGLVAAALLVVLLVNRWEHPSAAGDGVNGADTITNADHNVKSGRGGGSFFTVLLLSVAKLLHAALADLLSLATRPLVLLQAVWSGKVLAFAGGGVMMGLFGTGSAAVVAVALSAAGLLEFSSLLLFSGVCVLTADAVAQMPTVAWALGVVHNVHGLVGYPSSRCFALVPCIELAGVAMVAAEQRHVLSKRCVGNTSPCLLCSVLARWSVACCWLSRLPFPIFAPIFHFRTRCHVVV